MEPVELTANPLADLEAYDQWVTWRYEERNGKSCKVPYNPTTGKRASVTNSSHWTSAGAADSTACHYDGVGFVFTDDDPFVMIDLDDCLDEYGFAVNGMVEHVIHDFNSYTEISPSGRGLRIIVTGDWDGPNSIKGTWGGEFAIYSTKRYTTITADVYGKAKPIREAQGALDVCRRLFSRNRGRKRPDTAEPQHQYVIDTSLLEDEHPRVKEIVSTVWPVGDRSTKMQSVAATMWNEGATADHAYAVCMLNPSFAEKIRSREWFDAYCWRKASNLDYRAMREACKQIRVLIEYTKRFGRKVGDPELYLAHLRATLRHGNIEKADVTRSILHSYLPHLSDHAIRVRYTLYLRTDQKHHSVRYVGTPGTKSSYSLLTAATKRILLNWSGAPSKPLAPSVDVVRAAPPIAPVVSEVPAPTTMSVKRRSSSGTSSIVDQEEPALVAIKLFRDLMNLRSKHLRDREWGMAEAVEVEMEDFMPPGTLKPGSWTKEQYKMARNGVLPMRKEPGQKTRGYSSLYPLDDDWSRQNMARTNEN